MVSTDQLKPGNKYTFFQNTFFQKDISFRGTFLETRCINKKHTYIYIIPDGPERIMSIIFIDLIIKVETLDDVLQGKTILNQDVISMIEEYL